MSDIRAPRTSSSPKATAFGGVVIAFSLVGGIFLIWRQAPKWDTKDLPIILVWAGLIAVVELLPVTLWRGLQMSLGLPLLIAVAILYPPVLAGVAAFLGSADPREFRRQIDLFRTVFNRCQVALSVFAASWVFHSIANISTNSENAWPWPPPTSPAWLLIVAAMLAAAAEYLVNSGLVTVFASLNLSVSPRRVMRQLRIGNPTEFLVSYLGLGVLGLMLAVIFVRASWWAVPAVFAPLLFARAMFIRSQALEVAHEELKEREQVLRQLSNAIAEERADERLQIAGYLHDDLAQILFRLSIQVDVARKLLDRGDYREVGDQLEKIRDSKQETSDRIRALIRDLHRSPLGAKGLAEAIESFSDEVGKGSEVRFHRDVEDVPMPAPIALLLYHIAREGVMNALKHAHATDIWITVRGVDDQIELELRDNGDGFDMNLPGPEGHFGMAMMRERAQIGGGTLEVHSAPDNGTTITVRFPMSLLQPEPPPGEPQEGGSGGEPEPGASLDTSERTVTEVSGSNLAVRASR
jgi:signal transduction histidine kinase